MQQRGQTPQDATAQQVLTCAPSGSGDLQLTEEHSSTSTGLGLPARWTRRHGTAQHAGCMSKQRHAAAFRPLASKHTCRWTGYTGTRAATETHSEQRMAPGRPLPARPQGLVATSTCPMVNQGAEQCTHLVRREVSGARASAPLHGQQGAAAVGPAARHILLPQRASSGTCGGPLSAGDGGVFKAGGRLRRPWRTSMRPARWRPIWVMDGAGAGQGEGSRLMVVGGCTLLGCSWPLCRRPGSSLVAVFWLHVHHIGWGHRPPLRLTLPAAVQPSLPLCAPPVSLASQHVAGRAQHSTSLSQLGEGEYGQGFTPARGTY